MYGESPTDTHFTQSGELLVGQPQTLSLSTVPNSGDFDIFLGTLESFLAIPTIGTILTITSTSSDPAIQYATLSVISKIDKFETLDLVTDVLSTGGLAFLEGTDCAFNLQIVAPSVQGDPGPDGPTGTVYIPRGSYYYSTELPPNYAKNDLVVNNNQIYDNLTNELNTPDNNTYVCTLETSSGGPGPQQPGEPTWVDYWKLFVVGGSIGPTGAQGVTSHVKLGNVLIVDSVYGDDLTGSVGGSPYLTVNAAINGLTAPGQTIWVMPGTYDLSESIIIPENTCLRGLNVQTCTIQMMGVTGDTTLITMGEYCRIEDLTLKLQSYDDVNLIGIQYGGTSSQTSKLRTCVLTVDNSESLGSVPSNVYGINFSGTGNFNESVFSFNSVKGSTINLKSNGDGNKRGLLISGSNQVSTRDTNIFVSTPSIATNAGSYVGVETNDTNNLGSIQMRSTSISSPGKKPGTVFTASDILQTRPASISSPSYLASPGIQIGPGVDLVTKTAGNKPFTTYNYPTVIYYGIKGNLKTSSNHSTIGYLWPGTQAATNGAFPDPTLPAAFYKIQQPAILSGMSVYCNIGPGTGHTVTFQVYRTPKNGTMSAISGFEVILTDSQKSGFYYNSSYDFNEGDFIHLGVSYTGGNGDTTQDITVQLDMF